jgi:LPS-assembly protein
VEPATSSRSERRRAARSFRPIAALLALAAAQPAVAAPVSPVLPTLPGLPPSATKGDIHVAADQVSYDPTTGRVSLEGHAVVRRGDIVLRARSAEYDPATGEVRASGGVLLTDPTRVVSADAVRAVIGGEAEATGVVAFVKGQPVDLTSALCTADEAAHKGQNLLSFSTPSLEIEPDGRMLLRGARLTLCDCPGGKPPAWEITASDADVLPGKRAILRWPVLRIAPPFMERTVPVFVFPWLYFPLSDRQTGLLIPTVGSTGSSGFSIAQPLYITLGRSADATITPTYAFGRPASDVNDGKPSVRGPGAIGELRWAPAERAEGRAELTWIQDLDAEPGGASGDRFALLFQHQQQVGDATSLQSRLQLATDPVWVRDMNPDVLLRSIPYRRSDVLGSVRGGPTVTEAVASYLQPFDPVEVSTLLPYGKLGADRAVSSRWGTAAASLVPVDAGPLQLSGRFGVSRFSPVQGINGTARDVVGRLPTTRGDVRAEIAAPFVLGDALVLAPFVRGAALGYAPDGGQTTGIAWGVAGAVAESEISRRFGELRHTITPRLEWRAATPPAGDPLAVPAFDLYDRSTAGLLTAAPGDFNQLRGSIETRLQAPGRTALRAELGQDLDLRAGRFEETFATVSASTPGLTVFTTAKVLAQGRESQPPPAPCLVAPCPLPISSKVLDRFTELRAGLTAEDRRGDGIRFTYGAVGPGGSQSLVAGLDPLFDPRTAAVNASATGTLELRAAIAGARLGYEALIPGRATFLPACTGTGERQVSSLQVQQHTATFTWNSPCNCFRLTAVVRLDDCGNLSYSASIDLARLGSHGGAFGGNP